jgi:O-methyltransferase
MPMSIPEKVRSLVKDISLRTGIYDNLFFRVYSCMLEPKQLVYLIECIIKVGNTSGCIVEAGCAHGATTVFLKKFIDGESMRREYFALDTFSGFVRAHTEYEVSVRGKPKNISKHFTENKKVWFDKSMNIHRLTGVKSIQVDVTRFDFNSISPIAFCLLDVDLYKPIKDALPKIYAAMAPGGIIVVDDCKPQALWDGALQAYEEFVRERSWPSEIAADRLGVIRVPKS